MLSGKNDTTIKIVTKNNCASFNLVPYEPKEWLKDPSVHRLHLQSKFNQFKKVFRKIYKKGINFTKNKHRKLYF